MKVRINNNQPNAAQRKVLREECVKEFDKLLSIYNKQVALQVIHILRFDFGFGQERLKRFADRLAEMQIKNIAKYEVENDEIPDICEIQLRESGIDLKEIFNDGCKELSSTSGNVGCENNK